jgi:hypothetical protein
MDLPASIDLGNLYYSILAGNWLACLTVWENAGMPENYELKMDYEYQGKKEKIHNP